MNVELFPCSGGVAEGFRRAGITFDLAFEADPNACDSYAQNLGHRPVQLDVRDLLAALRSGDITLGPVDLFVADPPCTPWSRAGKRLGVEDERDMLNVTTEIIRLVRPRAYLIGNVPGLVDSKQWHHLQAALAPLSREGYCIRDYASLDAADYGTPQHRVRPWWFGHLAGPCIRWPAPTHAEHPHPALPGFPALKPWVTCRQALQHLPLEQLGRPVRLKRADPKHPPCAPDAPGTTVRSGGNGNASPHLTLSTAHPPATGDAKGESIVKEWPWDRPSTTVTAHEVLAPPGRDGRAGEHQRHHPNAIILSLVAARILQGLPETWVLAGKTKKAQWSQVGQLMPPPLAEAVARAVRAQMEAADRLSTG